MTYNRKKNLERVNKNTAYLIQLKYQGGRGHWTVNYTGTQSFYNNDGSIIASTFIKT